MTNELGRERKSRVVCDDLRVVRAALNWALEQNRIPSNPVVGIKFPRVPRQISKRLSPDEFKHLIETIDRDGDRAMALILILTGMRIDELLSTT